ncbi:phytanoyl-CoA dioxygenase PhyH [Paraburkholderia sp. BL6665CI2N2]|uniref:phytanoyl-CoA dioxygenase family protein n=1 Tax=Paraburkholderia sp. BL6665CI2N2 TaxID=1938806 RepID=UPI001065DEE9|nr:phytanoyl-CoA dioxygenase family protein [Paraburkholderia sp. BL6665CI2N2]TDY19953.1 phytanoyl-CoA dioxygenase PhyH [Paraburkholderia sp. BL6665CI2N2]
MQVTEQMKRDLARDGAIVVRGLFSPERLKRMREAFDYGIAHPSPLHGLAYEGTPYETFNDYGNVENRDVHVATVKELGLDEFVASLWDTENLWFVGEELFIKKGGNAGRSPWHQDNSYVPVSGPQMLNIWTSFEKIPRHNALEFVRGSHAGVQYNGTSYNDANDHTAPLWIDCEWPRLPDIEADRAKDPTAWDVFTWDLEPGDALVFHSGMLHGGAPVTPDCPDRHTLVYRFYGDKVYYRPLPTRGCNFPYDISELNDPSLEPGEPYRSSSCTQLR